MPQTSRSNTFQPLGNVACSVPHSHSGAQLQLVPFHLQESQVLQLYYLFLAKWKKIKCKRRIYQEVSRNQDWKRHISLSPTLYWPELIHMTISICDLSYKYSLVVQSGIKEFVKSQYCLCNNLVLELGMFSPSVVSQAEWEENAQPTYESLWLDFMLKK